jgi:septal ring factor EnvC (AmiA/AmiB activator)
MASRIMFRDQQAHLGRGILPAVLLSVVATLAVVAPLAIFFWPDKADPQVNAQETTSGIEAINDRPAAEKFIAQTRGTKAINNSLAAEDQFIALSARLSTLQDAVTRILRDNAALAEQLRATQTQMAQDNALVAEQLNALMQMMARGNEKPQHRRRRR